MKGWFGKTGYGYLGLCDHQLFVWEISLSILIKSEFSSSLVLVKMIEYAEDEKQIIQILESKHKLPAIFKFPAQIISPPNIPNIITYVRTCCDTTNIYMYLRKTDIVTKTLREIFIQIDIPDNKTRSVHPSYYPVTWTYIEKPSYYLIVGNIKSEWNGFREF